MKLLLMTVAVTFLAGCSGVAKDGELRHTFKNESNAIVCKTTPIPVENIDTHDSDEITYFGDTFIYERRPYIYDSDEITYYDEPSNYMEQCSS